MAINSYSVVNNCAASSGRPFSCASVCIIRQIVDIISVVFAFSVSVITILSVIIRKKYISQGYLYAYT